MSIVLVGSTSGSITLQEPAVAGSTVLDLPATSGTILTTGSSGQVIPKAALPTGSVLQVVSASITNTPQTSSATPVDLTGLTTSITPIATSSKILISWNLSSICSAENNSTARNAIIFVADASNNVVVRILDQFVPGGQSGQVYPCFAGFYLHSPASTSALTYKIRWYSNGVNPIQVNNYITNAGTVSTITVMEIAA